MFKSKLLWRVVVIILIAVFSIATIVSCGGDAPTQSTSLSTSVGGGASSDGENSDGGASDSGSITLPEEAGSKYTVDVPFASSQKVEVDYRDSAKLNQLWFDQINRKAANDGKVFAIRNGRNPHGADDFQKRLPAKDENQSYQDYYYFADNGDIYYKPDNRLIKKFVGAVIVDYVNCTKKNYGFNHSVTHEYAHTGQWTVGAIYKMALSEMEAEIIYGKGGSARNAVHTFIAANITLSKFWNGVYYENIFFTRGFDNGYLEVLVMNPSANEGVKDSAGIDSYYWYGYKDRKVMMYESVHLGKKPEELIKTFTRYVKFTDSWETPWWNFLFMPGHPN